MSASYHQFCPVAKAMELLDERWTMLVVRELVAGSTRFNDLRRGVPRMSPTLLSKRLGQLVRAGVVDRVEAGGEVHYRLTEAGQELRTVVEALGAWGVRWVGNLGDADLDPRLLMWDMHRHVDHGAVPSGRTVIRFRFPDASRGERDWWLVIAAGEVDVCDHDPGHPVAVAVTGSLRRMVAVWRGDTTWAAALRSGDLVLEGPATARRALPRWFTPSTFAPVTRPTRSGAARRRAPPPSSPRCHR